MDIQKGQNGNSVSLEAYRIFRGADNAQVQIRATLLIKTPDMVPNEIRVTMHYSDDDLPRYNEVELGRCLLELLGRRLQ
jgi:hypothetical protein